MHEARAETREWAWSEFGSAELGDARRRARLLRVAALLAVSPAGTVTQALSGDADRQGAYGLLESSDVSADAIAHAMRQGCARRCAGEELVLVPVDGSSLNISDHQQAKGLGSVGAHFVGARGLKVITAIATTVGGAPLGISGQTWWSRPSQRPTKHRHQRALEDKELQRWLDVMAQTREAVAAQAPHTKCWFQIDREGDAWPILLEAGKGAHYLTVRAHHNRRVVGSNGRLTYLHRRMNRTAAMGHHDLEISASRGRAPRRACMTIRVAAVTIDMRDKRTGKHFRTTLTAVLTREQRTTPRGEKPLEWLLLTSYPVSSFDDARRVISSYAQRWRIEDFHRTWKSGACHVEDTQLRTRDAVVKWATLLAAVAVRIERIKHLSRTTPAVLASVEFSAREIRAILLLRHKKKAKTFCPPGAIPTLEQATRWLADLGGYTGKSSGGPPGSITIARGLKRVEAVAEALEALEEL